MLIASAIVLLIFPVPVIGQELPQLPPAPEPSAAEAWVAQYEGGVYEVVDGVVRRVDGEHAKAAAAAEVLRAKRVHDLVSARPDLVERLAQRQAHASDALENDLLRMDAAVERLTSFASGFAFAQAEGLLGDLLEALPVHPADLATEAGSVRSALLAARDEAPSVQEASRAARAAVDAFDASHAVEHKRAALHAFVAAVPVYEEAASRFEAVDAGAQRALADAEALLDHFESRLLSASGLGLTDGLPSDLAEAIGQLRSAAAVAQVRAEELRSDAAFLRSVADETVDEPFPIGWVVGGGTGLAGAGIGGLWWLRRRPGIL